MITETKDAISFLRSKSRTFYHSENLITIDRNLSFTNDELFMSLYNKLAEDAKERGRLWRLHVFNWAFGHGMNLEGDIFELGVYRGFSSAVAVRYHKFNKQSKKYLYLFDTWDGIPESQLDQGRKQIEKYKDPENYKKVIERFSEFKNVKIIKGEVPKIFESISLPEKISFLHVDLNSSIAEIAALDILFQKVVPGGIILLDDFGLLIAREQMVNETLWFARKNYFICELPTSQALVIKRI